MANYSVVVRKEDGTTEVRDISFRNRNRYGGYQVWLGEERLGTIDRGRMKVSWDAYSHFMLDCSCDHPERKEADRMRKMDGFHTRFDAAEFLLLHWGYRKL